MKVVLKLLAAYLAASLVMTGLSVILHPPHAHLPASVLFLFFPLVPWVIVRDLYTETAESGTLLLVGVFVVVFGGMAWLASRSR